MSEIIKDGVTKDGRYSAVVGDIVVALVSFPPNIQEGSLYKIVSFVDSLYHGSKKKKTYPRAVLQTLKNEAVNGDWRLNVGQFRVIYPQEIVTKPTRQEMKNAARLPSHDELEKFLGL